MHAYMLAAAALLISAGATWGAWRYARWRQLLDLPGHRRSHVRATPRGGGIGLVLAVLLCAPWLHWPEAWTPILLAVALVAVAGVGWWDDHKPLSARLRFTVHMLAAMLCAGVLVQVGQWHLGVAALLLGLASFWLAACINAWNFMDGSNGLVTIQSFWLALCLLVVFMQIALEGVPAALPWVGGCLILAAACSGFLPFNFPRALIFMGDVGSGALGLLCGVLLLVAFTLAPDRIWILLLLPSGLLVDAGLTLLFRLVSGRRWYQAHREHLYQWLIRSGWTHAQVALAWLGWNLLVVLPVCVLMQLYPDMASGLALLALALALALWWYGKGAIRRGYRRKRRSR